jgi:hypothetical protein
MAMFNNCNFDVCRSPFNIVNHQDGIFFNNCTFTTGGASYNGVAGSYCFAYGNMQSVLGKISFTNCEFRTFNTQALLVNSNCSLVNCAFDNFNIAAGAYGAIVVDASGVVLNLACTDIDGRSTAGGLGIISNTAQIDLTIHGGVIKNLGSNVCANVRGRFYASGVAKGAGHFFLANGVSCTDVNGVLTTYQIPSAFTVTSQGFAVGDRFAQQISAVGQPKGWVCTVAGTPGTWVSEGNL